MTVDQMRMKLFKVYDSTKWRNKVIAMANNQVVAIYFNFLERGEFKKQRKKRKECGHQMTLGEWAAVCEDKEDINNVIKF